MSESIFPKAFVRRRLHSLLGVWLVVFLTQHLLTNSQAALLFGEDGRGFIHSVNAIHELPFLPLIEVFVLGFPILLHAMWGFSILWSSEENAFRSKETLPSLSRYRRNRAYSWQRVTSWFLVIGILAHVIHMRFIEYPESAQIGSNRAFMVRLDVDEGLPNLAARLGVDLLNQEEIELLENQDRVKKATPEAAQENHQWESWLASLKKKPLGKKQIIAVASDFGTAELLVVRETFKMPIMLILYTVLVIAACYHAFNGLWTALLTWGIIISKRSQNLMRKGTVFLMLAVMFLGLIAVWGTYWINLKN